MMAGTAILELTGWLLFPKQQGTGSGREKAEEDGGGDAGSHLCPAHTQASLAHTHVYTPPYIPHG